MTTFYILGLLGLGFPLIGILFALKYMIKGQELTMKRFLLILKTQKTYNSLISVLYYIYCQESEEDIQPVDYCLYEYEKINKN